MEKPNDSQTVSAPDQALRRKHPVDGERTPRSPSRQDTDANRSADEDDGIPTGEGVPDDTGGLLPDPDRQEP